MKLIENICGKKRVVETAIVPEEIFPDSRHAESASSILLRPHGLTPLLVA